MRFPGIPLEDTSQLCQIFANQRRHAVRIMLTLELIPNGNCHNTHQSRQQNPHHNRILLTYMVYNMQENLQSSSCILIIRGIAGKIKKTMQDFMKKCFFSVLAILCWRRREKTRSCSLQGRGLQGAGTDGGCGRRNMPETIIQVEGRRRKKASRRNAARG